MNYQFGENQVKPTPKMVAKYKKIISKFPGGRFIEFNRVKNSKDINGGRYYSYFIVKSSPENFKIEREVLDKCHN